MKKILALMLCVAASTSVYSQIRIGVKGGPNLSNQRTRTRGMNSAGNLDYITGFQTGLTSDIKLTSTLHLRPELQYTAKGSQGKGDGIKVKSNPGYLELPLNLVVYREGAKLSYYAGVGPVLAYGISGKYKFNDSSNDLFGKDGTYRRFELGFNIVAGIDLPGGFTAALNFNRAITKAWSNTIHVTDMQGNDRGTLHTYARNFSLGISVGYFFYKK
ncbi:PorT family protein [Pseudoflavitalea sp. G-6-1-2]|uniref:porin family protein n=1 Tax=Pseudoflavitalea sp. G-6-1-2 TaxID=2728841 RepID=UPI00146B0FA1|nr:porin family protein [Pseudoflavitalea sp. G-6-1-2]NML23328.1 PorT family protein [Pseudoflavitalea sp. G-6-1-2]